MILGVRVFLFIQLMQLALKLDRLINWEWKNVFWMTWIVLVTVGFYLMGLFILLVLTAYYTYKGDADAFQLKGLLWCFSNISDFSVGVFLILLSMIKCLLTGDESTERECLRFRGNRVSADRPLGEHRMEHGEPRLHPHFFQRYHVKATFH